MYKRNKLLETELEEAKKQSTSTAKSSDHKSHHSSSEKNNNHKSGGGIFDSGSNGGGVKGVLGSSSLSGSTSSIQKPLGHVSSAKAKLLSKFSSKFSDN